MKNKLVYINENKKLNNGGWGFAEMIVLSCILLLCLLVAAYLIYNLYNSF